MGFKEISMGFRGVDAIYNQQSDMWVLLEIRAQPKSDVVLKMGKTSMKYLITH